MLKEIKERLLFLLWSVGRKDKASLWDASRLIQQKQWDLAYASARNAIFHLQKSGRRHRADKVQVLARELAVNGRLDLALRLLDDLWVLDPANIEKNLHFYTRLGMELYHISLMPSAMECWNYLKRIQKRLARENEVDRLPLIFLRDDWTVAYGHLGFLSVFLKKCILEKNEKKIIMVAKKARVSNLALLEYFRPYLDIHYDLPENHILSRLAALLSEDVTVLPSDDGSYQTVSDIFAETNGRWKKDGRKPILQLKEEHAQKGQELLAKLGVAEGQSFACFHARTYRKAFQARNANIETYREAIQALHERGGAVIRIGDRLETPLAVPHLIDYASGPHREPWGDVFLGAACRFLLGTCSGPQPVVEEFGVPTALVNWYPLAHTYADQLFFIPKLIWHRGEKRLLSFAEMLRYPYEFTTIPEELERLNVEVVDNTSDEIRDFTLEMLDRLDHKNIDTEEEEALQGRFLQRMREYRPLYNSRIGKSFLNSHKNLLN